MAPRDRRVAVARKDDLALLGDLESTGHRSWRLGANRAVGRAATAPQRSPAPMKHGEANMAPLGPRCQLRLRFVQREGGRQRPDLLGRIRIAELYLQAPAPAGAAPFHPPPSHHPLLPPRTPPPLP